MLSDVGVADAQIFRDRAWAEGLPSLFQLPARFKADREQLGSFLKMLPK